MGNDQGWREMIKVCKTMKAADELNFTKSHNARTRGTDQKTGGSFYSRLKEVLPCKTSSELLEHAY